MNRAAGRNRAGTRPKSGRSAGTSSAGAKAGPSPHPWNVTPKEAFAIQEKLRTRVLPRWDRRRRVRLVAGTDMSVKNRRVRAAVVVLTFPDLEPVEEAIFEGPVPFPYVPGLLSFRECPPLLEAFTRLRRRPDLLLADGQGIAHPRGLGLAAHLGVLLDLPAVGCAKSRLCGEYEEPGLEAGACSELRYRDAVVGAVLRTRSGVKPLFVSIGHRIDLEGAVRFTLACCRGFRLPEPTRAAHRAAGNTKP